jgi:flagellar biosynthesis anti-sigma factor FlgM
MTTSRVSNSSLSAPLVSPLVSPKTDADKTADVAAPATLGKVAAPAAPASPGDRGSKRATNVQISSDAKDKAEAFQRALDLAKATPDVREDRVAELKQQIADGTYKADPGNIADGMMREAIKEHLANNDR